MLTLTWFVSNREGEGAVIVQCKVISGSQLSGQPLRKVNSYVVSIFVLLQLLYPGHHFPELVAGGLVDLQIRLHVPLLQLLLLCLQHLQVPTLHRLKRIGQKPQNYSSRSRSRLDARKEIRHLAHQGLSQDLETGFQKLVIFQGR